MIAVIIPTYGRADRLARVAANIAENTETDHRVVFAVEVDDTASIDVAAELDVDVVVNERKANYSGAITTAYLATPAEHVFAGADDLNFHPGWDIPALALMDDWTMVVGTNDLLNPYVTAGLHATHYLVDRRYLDEVGGVVDQAPVPSCSTGTTTSTPTPSSSARRRCGPGSARASTPWSST